MRLFIVLFSIVVVNTQLAFAQAPPTPEYEYIKFLLDLNRNDWDNSDIIGYSFRFGIECDGCENSSGYQFEGTANVTAEGEKIATVSPTEGSSSILLVKELHDKIDEAIKEKHVDIWPSYFEYGIPSSVRLQKDKDTKSITYHLDVYNIIFKAKEPSLAPPSDNRIIPSEDTGVETGSVGAVLTGRKLFQTSSVGNGFVTDQRYISLGKTSQ